MNWETIFIALIAAIPATVAAWQSRATHLAVNSRLTELLEITKREAGAQATLTEKAAEGVRKDEAAIRDSK